MAQFRVICRLSFEGFHCWPGAPQAVAFLRDRHRHLFQVEAERVVGHADRAVEIVTFRSEMDGFLRATFPDGDLGRRSCEEVALLLAERFGLSRCRVMEDGENGGEVVL